MKCFFLTIFFSSLLMAAQLYSQEIEISRCKDDFDCTPTVGSCGEIVSVNKNYLQKFRDARNKSKDIINCARLVPAKIEQGMSSVCYQKRCQILKYKKEKKKMNSNKSNEELASIYAELKGLEESKQFHECFVRSFSLMNIYSEDKEIENFFYRCLSMI